MRALIIFCIVGLLQVAALLAVVDFGKHLSDVLHRQVEMFAGKL